jgi:cyanophycin synthetase
LWSRHTAIEAVVACEGDEADLDRMPWFVTRLRARFPEIKPLRPLGHKEPITVALEAGGLTAAFVPCAFDFVPPTIGENGIEPAEISIDAVGRVIIDALDSLVLGGTPIDVVYRQYRSDDLNEPGEVWKNFRVKKITTDGRTTRAQVEFDDIATVAFPRRTYGSDFPGLFGGGTTS